jgi:hypothetical protein
MNVAINNSKPNASSFLPKNTIKVIERTNSVTQNKEGTTRTMKETVLVEANQDLILQMALENRSLKKELAEARASRFWNLESVSIAIGFCALLWLIFGQR